MKNIRGNALFLILIAVALFAGLSYAVTQSGRSSGNINKEQNILLASQIVQYVGILEQTINRLMLINGCSNTEISAENSSVAGYTNLNAPADNSCDLFHVDGGGLTYTPPNSSYLDASESAKPNFGDYWFTATNRYYKIGTTAPNGTGSAGRALIIYLNWITKDLCEEINNALGYPMPTGSPPIATGTRWDGSLAKWVGVYGNEYSYLVQPTGITEGYYSGCWQGDLQPSGGYHFYHILIVR